MDFGFTNDPTAMVAVYLQDGELWIKELLYQTRLTNQDISLKLKELEVDEYVEIVCDSAEPKSIEELRREGWNVVGAKKGADSIRASIDIIQRYKMNITKESVNLIRELRSYQWVKDKNGKDENQPIDRDNHLTDAIRYAALNHLGNQSSMEFA